MVYVHSPIEWRTEPEYLHRKNTWLQAVIVENVTYYNLKLPF